jgi:FkbM family methyltransferase
MNRLLKLYKILANVTFAKAFLQGCAAAVEHEAVLKALRPNYVVDIGANRGQFAVAAREYLPSATIHSIEPLTEAVRILETLFAGDKNFSLHVCAVGNERQSGTMHVSHRDHSSSLLPISDELVSLFPFTAEREIRQVLVLPLGDIINPAEIQSPALLKIDVQGYELDVLKGCVGILDKFQYIYVECSFSELYVGQSLAQDVLMFLFGLGYQLKGIYDAYYDNTGKAIQADFLFEKHYEKTIT